MNDPRVIELLEELVKWTKAANYEAVKKTIEDTLYNDNRKKAYMLTGEKTQREICALLNMSSATLSDMWQECERKGFLKKVGKSYQQQINLEDFGLAPKGFDPSSLAGEKRPEEPKLFEGKKNEKTEERAENN